MAERASYDGVITGAPFVGAVAVTKSDTTTFTPPFKELYIGGVGDVAIRTLGGTNVTFTAVPAGVRIPIRGDQVLSTGTTATNITAMW